MRHLRDFQNWQMGEV